MTLNRDQRNVLPAREYIEKALEDARGTLINEKYKDENGDIARNISIVITELEKTYAYFMQFVFLHLKED